MYKLNFTKINIIHKNNQNKMFFFSLYLYGKTVDFRLHSISNEFPIDLHAVKFLPSSMSNEKKKNQIKVCSICVFGVLWITKIVYRSLYFKYANKIATTKLTNFVFVVNLNFEISLNVPFNSLYINIPTKVERNMCKNECDRDCECVLILFCLFVCLFVCLRTIKRFLSWVVWFQF